ncbi:hypothetical protein ADUPG1_012438 [Aduncisulcus paluster]|uniref:HD/PDEase domain-containing protein n=1 Tax=Aduncisulcus paluster TaxID=2918883 RepID=A0ABQ5K1B7_9EUKA|nr:hypothetical protein ADUPG1_012438 [Aduncisulcus paluster]
MTTSDPEEEIREIPISSKTISSPLQDKTSSPPSSGSSQCIYSTKETTINDPIHGFFKLDPEAKRIVDTPQFQRLRSLRQNAGAHLVYPGAGHTRFEHSLGTYHLARKLCDNLNTFRPTKGTSNGGKECRRLVQFAALLHDLGHGPFSHTFEWFTEEIGMPKWSHEEATSDMIDLLLKENGITKTSPLLVFEEKAVKRKEMPADVVFLSKQELIVIKAMITGEKFKRKETKTKTVGLSDATLFGTTFGVKYDDSGNPLYCQIKNRDHPQEQGIKSFYNIPMFLFDIVSNKKNGVDVDRLDYLSRGSLYCGISSPKKSIDRILETARVVQTKVKTSSDEDFFKSEICFSYRDVTPLYSIFEARYAEFRQILNHPVTVATEYMIRDALIEADKSGIPEFALQDCLVDPDDRGSDDDVMEKMKKFQTLNDGILDRIGWYPESEGMDDHMKKAKEIVNNLWKRKLYKHVFSDIIEFEKRYTDDELESLKKSVKRTIIDHTVVNSEFITEYLEQEVFIHISTPHFGLGCEDPVKQVDFYSCNSKGDLVKRQIEGESGEGWKFGCISPSIFKELHFSVFICFGGKDLAHKIQNVIKTQIGKYGGELSRFFDASMGHLGAIEILEYIDGE